MFSGSLVALITPMLANGKIDYASLQKLLQWHLAAGTKGIVLVGTTGEGPTLELSEKKKLVAEALEVVGDKIPIIVGIGSNSTKATCAMATAFNKQDVAAFMVVVPYYNKPSQAGLLQHFSMVAKKSAKPILLYNVPSRTGCDLLPETVAELAKIKNIIGIKEASGDISRVVQLRQLCGVEFNLLSGDDLSCYQFMQAGGRGVVSVLANVVPEAFASFCDLCLAGEYAAATRLRTKLVRLHQALAVETNPISIKWAVAKVKDIPYGIRLPLTPLQAKYQTKILAAIEELCLKETAIV